MKNKKTGFVVLKAQLRRVQRIALLLSLWLALFTNVQAAATYADPAADIDRIVDLTIERRALMRDVAAWKWQHNLPITDTPREQALLEQMRTQARMLGIEPEALMTFFELQMRWARELQEQAHAEWRRSGERMIASKDLNNEIRPQLDRIGTQLLQALYLSLPELQSPAFHAHYAARIVHRSGLAAADAEALIVALAKQSRSEASALQRIRSSRILSVGLPGDYAPFAVEHNGELTGADVWLTTAFAQRQQWQVRFVRTSWSTLLSDYQANRFDIAAGGISITSERSAVAAFSLPYHSGGKTPIVRCGEESRFDTLAEINEPGVKLIVNPGGTNERFAREQLSRASLRVHPDNRTVFDEIAKGRADVMVTDDVEADLQVSAKDGLCRATKQTFTQSDKAWMLSNDSMLQAEVNVWMEQALRSGEVRQALHEATSSHQH